jgi:hypothetical protein
MGSNPVNLSGTCPIFDGRVVALSRTPKETPKELYRSGRADSKQALIPKIIHKNDQDYY